MAIGRIRRPGAEGPPAWWGLRRDAGGPDRSEGLAQVPLTVEDVLYYTEEGDFIVQGDPHDSDRADSNAAFKARLADGSTAVVFTDCRVDFEIPGPGRSGRMWGRSPACGGSTCGGPSTWHRRPRDRRW